MNQPALAALRRRLAARGLAGYVAATPSNIFYLSGFRSYFVSEWWRMHGTVFLVVPTDDARPVTLVVSDFEEDTARQQGAVENLHTYRLWVELRSAATLAGSVAGPSDHRPEQYDPDELDAALGAALANAGLTRGEVGTDLAHLTVETARRLERVAPGVTWADAVDDLYRLRALKQPWEVERLRLGVELSEAGMRYAADRLAPGLTAAEVRLLYQAGVTDAALQDRRYRGCTDNWVLPTVGGRTSADYGARDGGLAPGMLVKFDCGATVDGYRSDGGRTFAFGEPPPAARNLYRVVADAQQLAREMLRPGVALRDVFTATVGHVRDHGYPGYTRGHVGHSIGIDTFHEEPPFISATTPDVAQEGMVFAVEVPTYTPDVGAIMVEDLVLITGEGAECLHTMSHDLRVV